MRHPPVPNYRRFYDVNGWAFVGVALLLMAVFTLYPIGSSLWMSVHSGQGSMVSFVGLGNVTQSRGVGNSISTDANADGR